MGESDGFARDQGCREQHGRSRRHADGVQTHGMHAGEASYEDERLRKADRATHHGQHRQQWHVRLEWSPGDHCHARESEESSHQGRGTEALLPPEHREQERGKRHQRQQDLAETGVHPDEPVIDQPERAAEVQEAVEQRADQRPSTWERQPQHDHGAQEQRRGERESQAGAPQRRKLAVAEPDAHRVATGKDGVRHEGRERHPLAIGPGHHRDATPRWPWMSLAGIGGRVDSGVIDGAVWLACSRRSY